MKSLVALLVVLALAAPAALSGCVCEPLLEVRHCRPHQNACSPEPEEIRAWTASEAARFPEIEALFATLAEGEHGHAHYTPADEAAFWKYWGIDNSDHSQQLFIGHDDAVYRIRVYTCEGQR